MRTDDGATLDLIQKLAARVATLQSTLDQQITVSRIAESNLEAARDEFCFGSGDLERVLNANTELRVAQQRVLDLAGLLHYTATQQREADFAFAVAQLAIVPGRDGRPA